jgi:hypothetical protein
MRSLRLSWLVLLFVAARAFAQESDGGPTVEPRSSNPGGADDPAELVRDMGINDGGLYAEDDGGTAPVRADLVLPPSDAGSVLINDEVSGRIGASVRVSYQRTSVFPVDNIGVKAFINPFETRLRVNPEVHFRGFGFAAEADTAAGAIFGLPPDGTFASRTPHPAFNALELRQLYVEYKWKTGVFRAGQQLSQWGLGILANGGSRDPEAGEFGQQHFGNLTYRALLSGRPLFNLGGFFRAIEPVIAADLVVRDSTAELSRGDEAFQAVFALRFNVDVDRNIGLYAVYRRQRARGVTDNARSTDVVAIDFAGRWQFARTENRAFNVGFEIAGITGTTTQGRNDNAPVLNVRQLGAAAKLSYRHGRAQVYLDWGYASGDHNPGDDRLDNFRFDRDYKVGLVLFDEVLGWQSARSAFRAADPNLLGVAPEGVDLAPTGGSITSAWYLFPRARYGIRQWLDVYGGPLFAFSTARLTDPFNSRVGGGTPINYLGGSPGNYLGTELDLGVQARWKPIEMLMISLTFEGGLLLPGDAFRNAAGGAMAPVGVARLRLAAGL